jgi:hypothetical protein
MKMKKAFMTSVAVLSMLHASAAHADTLDITKTYIGGSGPVTSTWTDVPITYGLRETYDFSAGLGTELNPNADGPTRGFWFYDASGLPMHVVVTDNGIQTSGYTLFQFSTSDTFNGQWSGVLQMQGNGLQWNEQILVNGTLLTSPDQIVDVGNGPYSISAVFDISLLPGVDYHGASTYN